MIFVTVGTQLPFDRLVRAVDSLAPGLGRRVFAQTSEGGFEPAHIEWRPFIRPMEVDAFFREADVVVAHAGIGTILTARKYGKPLIVMPRRAGLGEHRNDHQLATVKGLEGRRGIYVAQDETMLEDLLSRPLEGPEDPSTPNPARERLLRHVDGIIVRALESRGG